VMDESGLTIFRSDGKAFTPEEDAEREEQQ
jgi:hypothetical protein